MRELFRQFSFPGGIPQPRRPGDARLDPRGRRARLRARARLRRGVRQPRACSSLCVVGDGEAETGPLAASWHSNKFLDPATDGAVLPILHLNGYKIANPTVLARIPKEELAALLRGLRPSAASSSTGDDPDAMHQHGRDARRGARRDRAIQRGRATGRRAAGLADDRAAHAEGLDRARGGRRPAGRGHVALAPGAARGHARQPRAPAPSSRRGCARYRPEELFDEQGALRADVLAPGSGGRAPDGRQPARQRRPAAAGPAAARLPRLRGRGRSAGGDVERGDPRARRVPARRRRAATRETFRIFGPDETASNRLGAVFEVTDRVWGAEIWRRRRSPRAGRPGRGGAQRAPVPGLARGLPAHRPPRPLQLLRGVHPHRRLDVQPARQVAEGHARDPVAAADRVAELPADLARLAPGPQRLLAPGPGLHRPRRQQEGRDRPRLPAAGRQLPAVGGRPLPAQPRLRQRDRRRQAARARLPVDGRGDRPLHARHRHLGLGEQRRGRRAGRRAGVRRRRPDARDAGGRRAPARAPARAQGARRQRRRPHAPAAGQRAPARHAPTRRSTRCSRPTSR